MVSVRNGNESERSRKLLLGIGFWVQGLRCFPWMGVNFFLKDGMRVDPSTLQILQNSANLPMVAKPFYGILSDSFYIFGQHRVPYIALGAFLQAVSWVTIALFAKSDISFLSITFYLLLGNLGASIVEVANDAIVAETGKQLALSKNSKPSSSGELQSFVWMASSVGGVMGNLIGGIAIDKFSTQLMFLMYGILLSLQFSITLFIRESSLDLPKSPSQVGFRKQLSELLVALKKPTIYYSIIWFAMSYAVIPALTGTMFYYQTQHLKIESSLLGISKVFGQAAMLLWGVVYNRHLKSVPPRKLIAAVQISMAIFIISDVLFVNGVYRSMGIPDSLYVVVFSGFLEVLYFFKILPFNVLMAQLCPPGCEGSVMAFVMSAIALAFIVSGYLGVALASYVGVTGDDFSGLPRGLLIQAVCTLFPLFWSSCIPDVKSKGKKKEN
ncbi:probable folate-biopterin transporter 7 [Olea europaea var. sylvestris]|uniref:probable folate-biopterin transporter 7 n=1 Tax=Olea europaea var. sylvestris TaxID=158386 RepID=UPI000C1D4E03|nr:probable folate-biopterin transporter 7 [Olea europaea var. sylvestris]XP_022896668.1 probable folate-biopterin transporter 7 [Olea europaea var. sylvestris]XP_022896669.1 probable folate-biopterin transporter 7 [Olea europaea var. sylvestris]